MKFKGIQSVVNNCKECDGGVIEQCKWSVMTHRLRKDGINTAIPGESVFWITSESLSNW